MTGLVAGIGIKAVLGGAVSKAKAGFAAIPPKVKIALAIIIAVVILFFVHQHYAHKALKAQYTAGYTQRGLDDAAAAKKLKDQLDAATKKISDLERKKNVEAHQRVDRAADTLLLRGSGAAACRSGSGAASPAIRPDGPTKPVDGQVARLPDAGGIDLIALPFPDAVSFARSHDACEVDKASWESWYKALQKAWPK